MSDLDILHQMNKNAAKLSLADNYGKKKVTLIEPQHANSSVTIFGMSCRKISRRFFDKNMPENVIVIKADAFKSPDTVFNGSYGECKRADFVIIADAGKKKIILYIEMKATKASEKEIIQQLTGAYCFVAYCQRIGQEFWNEQNFLNGYVHRFVSIGHTSIPKKKTQITRQAGTHDRPDRMLKIDWPYHLQFNHLAGT